MGTSKGMLTFMLALAGLTTGCAGSEESGFGSASANVEAARDDRQAVRGVPDAEVDAIFDEAKIFLTALFDLQDDLTKADDALFDLVTGENRPFTDEEFAATQRFSEDMTLISHLTLDFVNARVEWELASSHGKNESAAFGKALQKIEDGIAKLDHRKGEAPFEKHFKTMATSLDKLEALVAKAAKAVKR